MKIIYMAQGYPVAGGHEAHLLYFATEMRRRGHDVAIVVADPLPRMEHRFIRLLRERMIPLSSLADNHVVATRLLFGLLVLPWFAVALLSGRQKQPHRFHDYLRHRLEAGWLKRVLTREAPDVVHVLGRLSQNLWQALPPERTVLHHGTSGLRDASWDMEEWHAFRDFAERAAANLAPGSGVIANLRQDFGIQGAIQSLYTICPDRAGSGGMGSGRVLPKPAQVRFGVLCRLTEEKGIAHLLEALRLYRDRNGGVCFTFFGSGALGGEVRAFIVRHSLGDVTLQSEFESPEQALHGLDCFVHPSISDAMPMAIAEALMCGLPCIVTAVGGIPDLVRDGMEGFVIPPGDAEAICVAMERFAGLNVTQVTTLRDAARSRYEACCTPERVGNALEQVYRRIVDGAGAG